MSCWFFHQVFKCSFAPGSVLGPPPFLLSALYLVDRLCSSLLWMALMGVSLTQTSQLQMSVSFCQGTFTWLPLRHLKHNWSRAEISGHLPPLNLPLRVLLSPSVYPNQNLWGWPGICFSYTFPRLKLITKLFQFFIVRIFCLLPCSYVLCLTCPIGMLLSLTSLFPPSTSPTHSP